MGDLNKRVKRLEEGSPDHPPHIVAEAMRRIPTEQLRDYVQMLGSVVDGGAPAKEAEPAVNRITELCEEIKKEGSYD